MLVPERTTKLVPGVVVQKGIRRTLTEDGVATISIDCEIDFSNSDDLAACIRAAVLDWSPATVRIDVAGAAFMDSTGLGALIEGYRAAGEIEARFVVANPAPSLHRVLRVTGLGEFFGLPALPESTAAADGETQATGA
jgi:anti-anti-sigma factor